MHIVVNTRLLLKNKLEGIGWYSLEVLKRICRDHPEHQFTFVFDRPCDTSFIFSNNIKTKVLGPPTRHPFLWFLWFEFILKRYLIKTKPDLFISPDGYIPLNIKTPTISVIHDINFKHFPEDFPFSSKTYYNYFFPKFAKHADKIVTVSEFSKKDIINSYQIESEKINVTYNGCNQKYKPISEGLKIETKTKYTEGKDYFIYVGAFNPRKNIANLLKAFDQFKSETNSDFKLVLVGDKMFGTKPIERAFEKMSFKKDVVFTGRLDPEYLKNLTGAATALLLVSNFEGFGIPILEAFQCDVPVITSNTSSMPEVGGKGAIYADPKSIESISNAMKEISSNTELRNNLIIEAKIQRDKFNWDYTANGLWETVEELIKKN